APDSSTPRLYTLSLHDALPISTTSTTNALCRRMSLLRPAWRNEDRRSSRTSQCRAAHLPRCCGKSSRGTARWQKQSNRRRNGLRSEEHTSELQSRENLVCRLLL